jgi:hypothetical protein
MERENEDIVAVDFFGITYIGEPENLLTEVLIKDFYFSTI